MTATDNYIVCLYLHMYMYMYHMLTFLINLQVYVYSDVRIESMCKVVVAWMRERERV